MHDASALLKTALEGVSHSNCQRSTAGCLRTSVPKLRIHQRVGKDASERDALRLTENATDLNYRTISHENIRNNTAEDKLNHLKTLFYRLRMRAAYERLTSILSDPDECGMSALDCIYEIMENEVQRRDSNALASG